MPTTLFGSGAGDGGVYRNAAETWTALRTATDGTSVGDTDPENNSPAANGTGEATGAEIRRGFLGFDLSSIAGATVSAGGLTLTNHNSVFSNNSDTQSYNLYEGTQASMSALATSDLDNFGTTALATAIAFTDIPTDGSKEWVLNTDGTTLATSKAGTNFKLCFRISADYTTVAPTAGTTNSIRVMWSESASPPSLSLTYTLGGGGGKRTLPVRAMGRGLMIP